MRTTLSIDEDVLLAAKNLAAREHKTLGEVVSDLARQALSRNAPRGGVRNGVPLLAAKRTKGAPVTMELVNQLRDELL
jgi:hypothetical protein